MPIDQAPPHDRYLQIRRATIISALLNCLLAIGKIIMGWLGHSSALIADGM